MQLGKIPLEYSSQSAAEAARANAWHERIRPEYEEEPRHPERDINREVKKRRTALERKQSGGGRPSKA